MSIILTTVFLPTCIADKNKLLNWKYNAQRINLEELFGLPLPFNIHIFENCPCITKILTKRTLRTLPEIFSL